MLQIRIHFLEIFIIPLSFHVKTVVAEPFSRSPYHADNNDTTLFSETQLLFEKQSQIMECIQNNKEKYVQSAENRVVQNGKNLSHEVADK